MFRIGAENRTANAEIKNDNWSRTQIRINDTRGGCPFFAQPLHDFLSVWNWMEPARVAKAIMGKSRMNFREPLQRIPCRVFADDHVRVVGFLRFADGRI